MSICQRYRLSVDTQKVDKRVMSAVALIAILTWHDLKPYMPDEQFSDSLFRVKFCYILRIYSSKKSVI